MATEAMNLIQAFYAGNKRAEIEEENREFKKGKIFGYMGGIAGGLFDFAGALESINMFGELKEGVTELFDRRSLGEKIADETIEKTAAVAEAKTILKAAGHDFDQPSLQNITGKLYDDLGFVTTQLFNGDFTNKYNKYVAGTSLISKTPKGNTINYTVAKKNQPKPWNMGGGKMSYYK